MGPREFQDAMRTAGDVIELARRTGISQPSASSWSKVPAERVLSVDAVIDVAREILWPDLCGEQPAEIDDVDAVARMNTRCSPCCSRGHRMWPRSAVSPSFTVTRRRLASRMWPLRKPPTMRARKRSSASFSIFSLESGAASCFPTVRIISPAFSTSGRWRDCARISARMALNAPKDMLEPEDHAAILCEIMTGLASGRFGVAPSGRSNSFSRKHLAPWIEPLLRRFGTSQLGRFLPLCGNGWPAIHRDRNRSIRAPRMNGRAKDQEDAVMKTETQDNARTSSIPSCARRRRSGHRCGSARHRGQGR